MPSCSWLAGRAAAAFWREAAWPGGWPRGPQAALGPGPPGTPPLTPVPCSRPRGRHGSCRPQPALVCCAALPSPREPLWLRSKQTVTRCAWGEPTCLESRISSRTRPPLRRGMWSVLTTNLRSFSKHPTKDLLWPTGPGTVRGRRIPILQAEIPTAREAGLGWGSKARALPPPPELWGNTTPPDSAQGWGTGLGEPPLLGSLPPPPPGSRLPFTDSFVCQRVQENRVGPLPWAG